MTPSDVMRVVLVDDELPAQQLIRALLAEHADVELIGAYESVAEATEAIRRDRPDLVLLDIHLRGESGFDVIAAMEPRFMPMTVFVTAHDDYAIAAFEAEALDYLLKPLASGRFGKMLDRVRKRLRAHAAHDVIEQRSAAFERLVHDHARRVAAEQMRTSEVQRIPLRQADRVHMVNALEIDHAVVDGNHVRVQAGSARYRIRESLNELEERLPLGRFVRVNRSQLVNIERVREVQPWFHGEIVLILADASRMTTGRTHRERVRQALGIH